MQTCAQKSDLKIQWAHAMLPVCGEYRKNLRMFSGLKPSYGDIKQWKKNTKQEIIEK